MAPPKISPVVEEYLAAKLPEVTPFPDAFFGVLFKNKIDPHVAALALILNNLSAQVLHNYAKGLPLPPTYGLKEILPMAILMATVAKDHEFFKQFADAMPQAAKLRELIDGASSNQLSVVRACELLAESGAEITSASVYDLLMEAPFNWRKKKESQTKKSLLAQINTDLRRLGILRTDAQ